MGLKDLSEVPSQGPVLNLPDPKFRFTVEAATKPKTQKNMSLVVRLEGSLLAEPQASGLLCSFPCSGFSSMATSMEQQATCGYIGNS